MTAVVVFAGADSAMGLIPVDAEPSPGVAIRVPVAHPLQVQASTETTKRYLDAINNGERLREQHREHENANYGGAPAGRSRDRSVHYFAPASCGIRFNARR